MPRRKKTRQIEFKPFSRRQRMVLNWWTDTSPVKDYEGIIADGAIRSGKTLSMALGYVIWAMASFDGEYFGMCGKTIASFERNVLKDLIPALQGQGYTVTRHRADNTITIENGETSNTFFIFGGKDEASQDLVQGITLAGCFFDEVALMPESFVNQATSRCSVEGSKLWFNCNPESPRHWFKQGWIDGRHPKKLLYVHFSMDDNPSLSEEKKAAYRARYTGVFYRRYVLGLWAMAEGLVYNMFDPERHTFDPKGWEWSPFCWYYVAIDYGAMNPFAALLIEYNPRTRVSRVIREVYYSGRETQIGVDNEAYYEMLVQLVQDVPIEQVIVDPSAASFINTIRKHARWSVAGADNDVLNGIVETTKYINLGLLQVSTDCRRLIEEFGMYRWDTKSTEDRVIKEHDHALDALRYYVWTILAMINKGDV